MGDRSAIAGTLGVIAGTLGVIAGTLNGEVARHLGRHLGGGSLAHSILAGNTPAVGVSPRQAPRRWETALRCNKRTSSRGEGVYI